MAADFRFVVHAAEAEPRKLAAGGAGDALPERCLADAGRADEAQDRTLAFRIDLAHGEIFENAALDLRQSVVVFLEDAAGFGDIDRLGTGLRPRQIDQPVEIVADHPVFGRGFRHALEPLELLARLIFGVLRHAGLLDHAGELGDLDRLVIAFTQLLLDMAELLAQDVVALLGRQRLLRLFADLLGQLQDLDAPGNERQHLVETLLDVNGLQHILFFGG